MSWRVTLVRVGTKLPTSQEQTPPKGYQAGLQRAKIAGEVTPRRQIERKIKFKQVDNILVSGPCRVVASFFEQKKKAGRVETVRGKQEEARPQPRR